MEIQLTHHVADLPKKTTRSKRLRKKMHLDEFAVISFRFDIQVRLFHVTDKIDQERIDWEDKILDVIYELDSSAFVYGDDKSFGIFLHTSTVPNIEEVIQNKVQALVLELTTYMPEMANIEVLKVEYSDAYYGDM